MAWAGIYIGSTVLIIKGPPFNIRGGVGFLSRRNYLFQPGSAALFFQNSTTCLSCLYRKYRAKIIYLQQSPLEIIHFKNTLAAPPPPHGI